MKVLKKGFPKSAYVWKEKVICNGKGNDNVGCGAHLEVHVDDVYMTHSYDHGGGHDSYFTITCPECKAETDINGPGYSTQNKETWKRKQRALAKISQST